MEEAEVQEFIRVCKSDPHFYGAPGRLAPEGIPVRLDTMLAMGAALEHCEQCEGCTDGTPERTETRPR